MGCQIRHKWAIPWLLPSLTSTSRTSLARSFSSLRISSKNCSSARIVKETSRFRTSRANECSLNSSSFEFYVQPYARVLEGARGGSVWPELSPELVGDSGGVERN